MRYSAAEKDEIIRPIQAGATEYLLKPFTIEDLQEKNQLRPPIGRTHERRDLERLLSVPLVLR